MSQSVQDVLSAITEASAALNREPQLQSRIAELERSLNQSQSHAQALEIHIVEYKGIIDNLQSKVRSLEVERDDMGFRQLEAEDKLDALRNVVASFTTKAAQHMPKPVEIVESKGVVAPSLDEMKQAASAASESSSNPSPEPLPNPSPNFDHMEYRTDTVQDSQPPHPIEATGQSESPLPSTANTGTETTAASVPSAASIDASSPKPYKGKTHSQVFGDMDYHVNYAVWIDGGGTLEGWNL